MHPLSVRPVSGVELMLSACSDYHSDPFSPHVMCTDVDSNISHHLAMRLAMHLPAKVTKATADMDLHRYIALLCM